MGGGGWVIITIFIALALVSAISHVLKSQRPAEAAPPRRKRERQPLRDDSVQVASRKEQDSFVAELERLKKKTATPTMKAVPVVKPKPAPRRAPGRLRLEELPAAEVVKPSGPVRAASLSAPISIPGSTVATIATIATIHEVQKPQAAGAATAAKMASMSQTMSGAAETRFSRDLLSMLKSKDALPMAVILTEVLGPPKSRRRG